MYDRMAQDTKLYKNKTHIENHIEKAISPLHKLFSEYVL